MKTKSPIINVSPRLARRLAPALLVLVALAILIPLSAQALTITTFDAPGAGTTAFRGTLPQGIYSPGETVGFTRDMANVRHGFLRDKKGAFTIFDVPGAGIGPNEGTRAWAQSPSGTIVGWYTGAAEVFHGCVRDKKGVFTTFDVPDAGTGQFQGTQAVNINPQGTTAGY